MAGTASNTHLFIGSFNQGQGLHRAAARSIGVVGGAQLGAVLSTKIGGRTIQRPLAAALALNPGYATEPCLRSSNSDPKPIPSNSTTRGVVPIGGRPLEVFGRGAVAVTLGLVARVVGKGHEGDS